MTVKFTGLSIQREDIMEANKRGICRADQHSWSRVSTRIRANDKAIDGIRMWLRTNCKKQWSTFKYHDPNDYNYNILVVRFEDSHEAIMFKLCDVTSLEN